MSRLIPQQQMTAGQLRRCCAEARAVLNLCHVASWAIQNSDKSEEVRRLADDIGQATRLAFELLDPVLDLLGREGDVA